MYLEHMNVLYPFHQLSIRFISFISWIGVVYRRQTDVWACNVIIDCVSLARCQQFWDHFGPTHMALMREGNNLAHFNGTQC